MKKLNIPFDTKTIFFIVNIVLYSLIAIRYFNDPNLYLNGTWNQIALYIDNSYPFVCFFLWFSIGQVMVSHPKLQNKFSNIRSLIGWMAFITFAIWSIEHWWLYASMVACILIVFGLVPTM